MQTVSGEWLKGAIEGMKGGESPQTGWQQRQSPVPYFSTWTSILWHMLTLSFHVL